MGRDALNSPYSIFFEKKSHEELLVLSQIKRFLECYAGDPELRDLIKSGKISLWQLAQNRGIELEDIDSLKPIVDPKFFHFRKDATLETWPLTAKWDEFYLNTLQSLPFYQQNGDSQGVFPEFDKWRRKQIIRTLMDVGANAINLTHPPISFELSDGCSVGCWFCGISAKKFGGHFTLDKEGEGEWRDILQATSKVVGKGIGYGFLYWATEPLDHPDYDKFLSIFNQEVGNIPQTTSAIPLKDVGLTRRVLEQWNNSSKFVPNRFSVLSTSIMKKIHAEFSPIELLGVELIMQGKGSTMSKSIAGKAIDGSKKRRSGENMEQGTIACVTGFLINLPNKTVRLVSPTLPSDEWPDGYYVYSSESFSNASELEEIMRKMVLKEVGREENSNAPIKLSESFRVEKLGSQQSIRDDRFGISMDIFNVMAPLLQSGEHSPNEIIKQAVKENFDPLLAIKVLQELMAYGMAGESLRPSN